MTPAPGHLRRRSGHRLAVALLAAVCALGSAVAGAAGPAAAAEDTVAPTAPSSLKASGRTCRTMRLNWSASTDDVGVIAYDVFHDGQLVKSVRGTTRSTRVTVLPGVRWGWYVNARDAAGNVSQASPTRSVRPPQCGTDGAAPSAPTGLTATASGTSVTLRWSPATDDIGVTSYEVRRDGTPAATVTGSPPTTTATDSGLAPQRTYAYTVVARDARGNVSAASATARVTTGASCSSRLCAVRPVASDTDLPWGLVTLPDGTVLYSRRDAHDVVALDPRTGAKRSLGRVPGVVGTDGEGGLMGLAVAGTFASDRWVYAMYTTATDVRVARLRYAGGRLETASVQVLLRGILRNKYHDGGRLRFGPDGMLYAATGDAQNGDYAQRLTGTGALNGKVLRMTPTGGVPKDNPFGSHIWSYGHRNPQGLAFDRRGRLWQQEFGNSEMDETNLVRRGGNHGWPQCEGTESRSGSGCGGRGLVAPVQTYRTSDASCSGLAVVREVVWVACARGARLYSAQIAGSDLEDLQQHLVGAYGRLRTVEPAADGGLWLTTTTRGDKDSTADNSDERVLHLTVS